MTEDAQFDVLMSGMVFLDIVFTELPRPPEPGVEVWSGGMGSSPGGIANLAVATARLGQRTALAAVFSEDGYGRWCRDVLQRQEGIDLTLSRAQEAWHTPVTVSLSYDGDRAMVTHGHTPPFTTRELIGEPPATRAVMADLGDDAWWRPCAESGSLVFMDCGWDPTDQWDRAVLAGLDGAYCFMPNEVEARSYTRTDSALAAGRALAELVPLAVVTRGAGGALAVDSATGETAEVPALDVAAIDPTGAGDVFGASLLTASLAGWPLTDRLRFATLCASLSVQQFGGALAAPGWGDIADWYACTRRAAAASSTAADLARDYGFLGEVIPPQQHVAVRRAEATIARWSDA